MSKGCLFRYWARAPIGHQLNFSRSSKVVRRRINLESKRSLTGKHFSKVEFWKWKTLSVWISAIFLGWLPGGQVNSLRTFQKRKKCGC